MCQALINWEAEARADEREKVTNDMAHVVISNMYREHFSIEQIARVMNKSEEEIREILKL